MHWSWGVPCTSNSPPAKYWAPDPEPHAHSPNGENCCFKKSLSCMDETRRRFIIAYSTVRFVGCISGTSRIAFESKKKLTKRIFSKNYQMRNHRFIALFQVCKKDKQKGVLWKIDLKLTPSSASSLKVFICSEPNRYLLLFPAYLVIQRAHIMCECADNDPPQRSHKTLGGRYLYWWGIGVARASTGPWPAPNF